MKTFLNFELLGHDFEKQELYLKAQVQRRINDQEISVLNLEDQPIIVDCNFEVLEGDDVIIVCSRKEEQIMLRVKENTVNRIDSSKTKELFDFYYSKP